MRALVALVAVLVIGCGSTSPPAPTAGTMDDVIAAFVLRQITIHNLVSGDPGCPSSNLQSNAVRLEVSIGDRSATHEVYLFRWRRPGDFTNSDQAFADCVAEYKSRNPEQSVSQVESEPWRVYGPGWPLDLGPTILEALRSAGGL